MESPDHTIWNVFLSLLSLQNYHCITVSWLLLLLHDVITKRQLWTKSYSRTSSPLAKASWTLGQWQRSCGPARPWDAATLPYRATVIIVIYREKLSNSVLQRRLWNTKHNDASLSSFSYWVIRCQETSVTCKYGFKPFKICLVYSILFYNVTITLFDLAFLSLGRVQVKIFRYLTNTH